MQKDRSGLGRPGWPARFLILLAGFHIVLGFFPVAPRADGLPANVEWLLRIVAAAAAALCVVFGPGLALRSRWREGSLLRDPALLWLPGTLGTAVIGTAIWSIAGTVSAVHASRVALVIVFSWLAWMSFRVGGLPADRSERKLASVVLLVLVLAVARASYSPGPDGELYGGTVSRSLEASGRSDSRISYHAVQLIHLGHGPYGEGAPRYYLPYNFSHRGPLAGIVAAPIVLGGGAHPPQDQPVQPWQPFDAQGFATYRIVLMVLALTVFTSLFGLVRVLGGSRLATTSVLIAALCPFMVHEVYFTWPKLLAVAAVVGSALLLLRGRGLTAGLLLGLGYLSHPLALVGGPSALALWIGLRRRRSWGHRLPQAGLKAKPAPILAGLAVGFGLVLAAWVGINGSRFAQGEFLRYAGWAGDAGPTTVGAWLESRSDSIANTLIPFGLVLWDVRDIDIPAVDPASFTAIRATYGYWTTVTLGVGLGYLPLFAFGLARFARRRPILLMGVVVIPFLLFAGYWGYNTTGLLREGLHPWFIFALVVAALGHGTSDPPRRVGRLLWGLASFLRPLEILAMMLLPVIVAGPIFGPPPFAPLDAVALLSMVAALSALARLLWLEHARASSTEGSLDVAWPKQGPAATPG